MASAKSLGHLFHNKQEFLDLLDACITRDDVKHMKPNPEGLLVIKQKLGIRDGRRVVMVGEMHFDFEAGKKAGAVTIGVKTGVCSEDELKAAGASFVFDSVKDIVPNIVSIEALLGAGTSV